MCIDIISKKSTKHSAQFVWETLTWRVKAVSYKPFICSYFVEKETHRFKEQIKKYTSCKTY